MGRVTGKVALVTGAARGLGRGIAQMLVKEGARVFLSDLNVEAVARTTKEVGGEGAFEHDVTNPEQWRLCMEAIADSAGRLDILVNNAGLARVDGANGIGDVSPANWERIIAVNGLGTMLGCQRALSLMRETGGGSIVNISSIAALGPSDAITAYGFSKAGVAQLTKTVAAAGAPHRIRCNSIHPGMIATPMLEDLQIYVSGSPEGAAMAREAFLARIPLGEFQTEEDIAYGVLYLVSDEARFVTGAQLVIDGGITL